ncbi:MAG: hypothetical protein GY928_20635 [Colwellia sp.]|nr:hypothetical protein [Colwellia sp.]
MLLDDLYKQKGFLITQMQRADADLKRVDALILEELKKEIASLPKADEDKKS